MALAESTHLAAVSVAVLRVVAAEGDELLAHWTRAGSALKHHISVS